MFSGWALPRLHLVPSTTPSEQQVTNNSKECGHAMLHQPHNRPPNHYLHRKIAPPTRRAACPVFHCSTRNSLFPGEEDLGAPPFASIPEGAWDESTSASALGQRITPYHRVSPAVGGCQAKLQVKEEPRPGRHHTWGCLAGRRRRVAGTRVAPQGGRGALV